ncbi:protein kinase family protein [Clostridium beijerinckii]|uniref:protein kinase family protein n=1 Tax=Clostridium beijerinckii TaxID=1520 RepID=UPI00047A5B13|nr:protein kinase family protein [Clostridium beijerinckii]
MEMNPGHIVKFIRQKEYTYQRKVGRGGTGKAILVKDEITGMNFVCKKYSPYNADRQNEYFPRFIDEIKIMYLLSHKNIVRIYNYFLYPEHTTGYILMENIEGEAINNYLLFQSNEVFESIFIQLIEGFEYLEQNKVLHRDIRNENILITNDGVVKIIDFGFGKKIEIESEKEASILLNWPVSDFPEEIHDRKYNHQTEIYFLGKLFNKLLEDYDVSGFKYQHIIDKMILSNPKKRIESFYEIMQCLSEDTFVEIDFTDYEKAIYITFVEQLISHIKLIKNELSTVNEPKEIINSLESVIKNSLLEQVLQNNNDLISCFIDCGYTYSTKKDIKIETIRDFYAFFKKLSNTRQNILISNIATRLKTIKTEYEEDDDMPF